MLPDKKTTKLPISLTYLLQIILTPWKDASTTYNVTISVIGPTHTSAKAVWSTTLEAAEERSLPMLHIGHKVGSQLLKLLASFLYASFLLSIMYSLLYFSFSTFLLSNKDSQILPL